MTRFHRKSALVDALHLNQQVQPDTIANFVSRAKADVDVNIRPSAIVLKVNGWDFKLPVGWWLILDAGGTLSHMDNDTFMSQHDWIGD